MNTYAYDPYGKTLSSTGTTSNSIMFQNAYFDSQSNLYKMGARYYNANEGRFTQTDPSGKNFYYNFAGDNPVNYSDPSGFDELTQQIATAGLAGCIGGVAGAAVLISITAGFGAIPASGAEAAYACLVSGSIAAYAVVDQALANLYNDIDTLNTIYQLLYD